MRPAALWRDVGAPSRAVHRDDESWRQVDERLDGGFADLLEAGSGEVEAAQAVQPVDTGEPHRVARDVDRPAVEGVAGQRIDRTICDPHHTSILNVWLTTSMTTSILVRTSSTY
jgi:hypothetical protein